MNYSSTATPRATLDKLSNCIRKWHASTTRLFPSVSSRYSPILSDAKVHASNLLLERDEQTVNCTRTLARAHTHARARAHAHEGDGWNRVGFVNGSGADKRRINTRTRQKPLDCDEPTTFPRARPTLYCALAQPSPPRWRDGGATRTLLRLCDPSTSSEGPLPFLPSFFFFSLLYMYIYFLFSLPSKIFSNVFTRKGCRDRWLRWFLCFSYPYQGYEDIEGSLWILFLSSFEEKRKLFSIQRDFRSLFLEIFKFLKKGDCLRKLELFFEFSFCKFLILLLLG